MPDVSHLTVVQDWDEPDVPRTAGRVVVPAAAAGDVTTVDDEAQLADGDELWARICDWARKVWPA